MRVLLPRGKAQLERAADLIRTLSPNRPWEISVKQYRAKRSTEQNAKLWAIYTEMARETGHTTEELHEIMKSKFLPPRFIEIGNETVQVPPSTAELNKLQFSELLERVQAFASEELGVVFQQ